MFDDKMAVICVAGIIAVCAMFRLDDPASIVNSVVAGLMGVAIGKGTK